eukprot:CAMPEP_0113950416 /NCGR_PEP_ID=MMETSP1339-20121228/80770_1 /TAXON_ID=94617 /ORGANISM="Fibrocapsa japonica" /LENGTH=203 /DNA_ID=CAMNT_0000958247 /DNA_START=129 /DNA_END=737 /DNA_ORIENTATION=+ /assembly_acc=CAM_ASM_000762
MVVEEDRRVFHRGKPNCRDPSFPNEAAVCGSWENLRLQVYPDRLKGIQKCSPPGVLFSVEIGEVVLVQRGSPFRKPPLHPFCSTPFIKLRFHFFGGHIRGDPHIKPSLSLGGNHVDVPCLSSIRGDTSFQHGQVQGCHVSKLFGLCVAAPARVAQQLLLLPPELQGLGADVNELSHGSILHEPAAMPCVTRGLDQQPPRASLP